MLSVARSADIVARIGGDEFLIVFEPNESGQNNLVARLDGALAAPIEISPSVVVTCPASIGYADTRTVGRDSAALLAAADADMYESRGTSQERAPHRDRRTLKRSSRELAQPAGASAWRTATI